MGWRGGVKRAVAGGEGSEAASHGGCGASRGGRRASSGLGGGRST